MNKINWINEEIKYCRCKINKAKQENLYQKILVILNPKSKNIDSTTFNDFHILLNEKKIQTLQQIKTELEAWEAVKKHLEYFPSDYWNGIPEDVITMTSNIDKKDYPQILKALEIKND